MPQSRRKPVTVHEPLVDQQTGESNLSAFTEMRDDLPYSPNDPHNGEALIPGQNPLALASRRMEEDRELAEFQREADNETREIDMLEAATAEFPESEDVKAYCVIWKAPLTGGKLTWTHRCSMAEWRVMGQPWLAREFGAGHYEVYMYRGGNKGLYKRPTCDISAEGAAYQRKLFLRDNPQEAPAAPAPSVGGGGTERLAQVMVQGFTQLGQLIAAQQQNQGGGEKEFLEKLLVYKQLFSSPAQAPVAESGAMGTLDLAVKIAGMINPSAAEKSTLETFADIAKEFMPAIGTALANHVPAQPARPAMRLAGPPGAPVARPQNPEQNPEVQNVNLIQNAVIRGQLKNLISKAEKGSDPALYADVIFDNLEHIPAEFAQRFLSDPNWMQWLASFDARVMQHREWFTELYVELRRIIEEENAAQQEPEPKNNLQDHAVSDINPANIHLAGGESVLFDNESESDTE